MKELGAEIMLTLKPIFRQYGDYICQRCIDRGYDVHLAHRDCRYGEPHECPCCRKTTNIVVGLTLTGHIKMLGK